MKIIASALPRPASGAFVVVHFGIRDALAATRKEKWTAIAHSDASMGEKLAGCLVMLYVYCFQLQCMRILH